MVVQFGTQSIFLQDEPENVQKRMARFVTGSQTYETDILEKKMGISERHKGR